MATRKQETQNPIIEIQGKGTFEDRYTIGPSYKVTEFWNEVASNPELPARLLKGEKVYFDSAVDHTYYGIFLSPTETGQIDFDIEIVKKPWEIIELLSDVKAIKLLDQIQEADKNNSKEVFVLSTLESLKGLLGAIKSAQRAKEVFSKILLGEDQE
jgi:hypothetical protein